MRRYLRISLHALIAQFAMLAVTHAMAEEPRWGTLLVRFEYDGTPPERTKVRFDKNRDFYGKFDLRDESLIVGKDGGLVNVLIYLFTPEGEIIPTHPDYGESANAKVTLDNRNGLFVPHFLTLRTTQTLLVRNSDPIQHATILRSIANNGFNLLLQPEQSKEFHLDKPEPFPATVWCGIEPWRKARLMVFDHPYSAVSDDRGRVVIANLPTGKWTFRVFHEKLGYIKATEKDGVNVEWPKGKFEVEIRPGDNDLGKISLNPKLFEN